MAVDRKRLAEALAAEAARRKMFESIPEPAGQGLPQAPEATNYGRDLENLSIGLGRGAVNQMEGLKSFVTSPVESVKGIVSGVGEAIRNPRMIAEALRRTGERAISGPLGLGEVIGENVNVTRMPKGVDKREIFIGENAKTWDVIAAKRAEEMEAAGVDPQTIWRETGTFRAPDKRLRQEISDVGAKLAKESETGLPANVAFEHPGGLYAAYPEIGERTTIRTNQPMEGGAEGSYNQNTKSVHFGETKSDNPDYLTKIGLHELQHAVQQQEDFARGGMPEIARRYMREDMQQKYFPYSSDLRKRSKASALSGDAYRAQYAQHLENLQQKDGIKPRQLTRMSDWYKYGSEISRQMAEDGYGWRMPAKAGPNRDFWIKGAVRRMQRMIEADRPEMRNAAELMSPNEAKNILRKTDKVFQQTQDAAIAANKLDDLQKTLESKSDYELYLRLLGEAEARATENRMNLTLQQRKETFPEYDVPLNEIIIRRR